MLGKLIILFALITTPLFGQAAPETPDGAAPRKSLYLPKNPVAAAYILGRLSNQELAEAPRSEFVYVAMLQRKGLDKKYRLEALDGLAGLRKTDSLGELLAALSELDKKGEESTAVLQELGTLVLQRTPAELAAKRTILERISTQAQSALSREIGYAALVTADGSFEPEWQRTEPHPAPFAELLLAASMVRDATLCAGLYPKIEPLLQKEDEPELRRAAITAIAAVPGREADAFKRLAALVQSGTERPVTIASLQRIPKKQWPRDAINPLVDGLVEYLQKVPPSDRSEADFASAVQFTTDLTSLLPVEKAGAINKILRGLGVRVFVIRTLYEQMLYDKRLIVTESGKPMEILFQNDDAMPHNLVVVAPGSVEEIGAATEKMSAEPDAQGRLYIPNSPKVLHATKLLQLGEKEKLRFIAPEEPGDYAYVCTFPGHWRRMVGTMVVVKDVDAYLASHPEPAAPQTTEWQVSDLSSDLGRLSAGRNLGNGKQLFTTLACVQCHKLGSLGYAFGPELTDVFQRWKGDRAGVLREIIEPSKVINDRYRNYEFELKNGDSVSGLIVKEDADSLTLQAGPSDALFQTLRKAEIKSRKAQSSSLMPVGLLNQISKEQILDLLAFIESGGKLDLAEHHH